MTSASARGPPVDVAMATATVASLRSRTAGGCVTKRGRASACTPFEVHLRRRAQRGEQRVGDAREVGADRARRLAHEIDRAELEAAEREVHAALRARGAQHHDGARRLAHDVAERLQPVELGHLDVERHDVRLERVDLPDGLVAVARRADDLEIRRAIDDLADDAPHERTVVDDQHRRGTARGHDLPS